MTDAPKKMIVGSMVVAALVAVVALSDVILGIPFSKSHTKVMDVLFLVSAGIVGYLSWDAYKDLR